MHNCIGKDGRRVADAVALLDAALDSLQDLQVRVISVVQELQVQLDWRGARDDAHQLAVLGQVGLLFGA